jgi:hypothetical protein
MLAEKLPGSFSAIATCFIISLVAKFSWAMLTAKKLQNPIRRMLLR